MPLISELSESDIKAVLKKYGLRELNSFREFYFGVENPNIKVKTEKGTFVLREWSNAKPKNIVFELSAMKELRKKGFPAPRLFKAANGKETIVFNGRRFALFEFMPGKHIRNDQLNSKQLYAMGKTLAEMQLALKNFRPKGKGRLKDLFDFGLDRRAITKAMPKLGKEHKKMLKELEKEVKELEPKLKEFKRGCRVGLVHHDFFYWNIKFKGNKIGAILDFGDACIGPWASDLANTLIDTAETNNIVHTGRIRQIIKGYQTKIALNKNEKMALPYLMLHRAIQRVFFETGAMLKQQKNRAPYEKWFKEDFQRAKQVKKQLQKIRKEIGKTDSQIAKGRK